MDIVLSNKKGPKAKYTPLDYLKKLSEQEVFDIISKHLLKQNGRCVDDWDLCCLHLKGRKCAIGCLIPDDVFDEYKNNNNTTWRHLVELGLAPSKHIELIERLRGVHDGYSSFFWKEELTKVAKDFKLKFKHKS